MSTTEVASPTGPTPYEFKNPFDSQFQSLADSMPELCWVANSNGDVLWRNARWYEYTGTTPEQVKGCFWQAVHDPTILPSVLERWKASLQSGQMFEMEFPLRGADGVFRWFLTRVTPVRDSEGKIVRWFGLNTNIHELRKSRQSLLEARNELERRVNEQAAQLEQSTAELLWKGRLLDLVNDGIFARDTASRIIYWNKGAERLYGWTSLEALGRSTHELLRTEFPEPLEKIIIQDTWEGELRHTKKDGAQIDVSSRWTRLRDEQGTTTGWLELNSDITVRKSTAEAARELSIRILRLQDEEHRRIARSLHDGLGQYLTVLKMSLNLLRANDGKQGEVLAQCSEMVDRCLSETRTISHLLHPPLLDEVGLKSALQWCADGFAQRSGIQVHLDFSPELPRLHNDVETALFRVVQEALTNVHRHSKASEVSICLSVDDRNIRLHIHDNGNGIPAQKLRSFVEPNGVTGVGLAGMRERVRESGGALEIESDQTGTLLRIVIPIAETTR